MKKWMMLLCCVLALNLAACGAKEDGAADRVGAQGALHFEVATQVYENEYKADDGTVLMAERYELPTLELRTESGELYTPAENVTANGGAVDTSQLTAQNAFNTEMNNVLAGLQSDAAQVASEAKELYAEGGSSAFTEGSFWTSELTMAQTYMTEGKLLSIAAEGYTYYGGVHPNSYSRAWNFDLTTGKFLTADDLADESSRYGDASTFQRAIYWQMLNEVEEKHMADVYFSDYDSYLHDFPTFATLNFTEDGLTVTFDQYIIAPYAVGPQEFQIPYDSFFYTLSRHMQSLLDMPKETVVLADYRVTEDLWAWFHMTTPPMDNSVPMVEDNDGRDYCRFGLMNINTMEQLRTLLRAHVTEELMNEWFAYSPDRFKEIDGKLYVLSADRGSDTSIGGESLRVEWSGDTAGKVIQTIDRQDWNDEKNTFVLTGEQDVYEYPFTLTDGHAVFSAFPCPY